jgi:hypothetical protein
MTQEIDTTGRGLDRSHRRRSERGQQFQHAGRDGQAAGQAPGVGLRVRAARILHQHQEVGVGRGLRLPVPVADEIGERLL